MGFYRNGCYLGDAFDDIRTGPGIAYFPAISLAFSEKLVANFGATPLRHPVDGYLPLQDPPSADVAKAKLCLKCLQSILTWITHRVRNRRVEKLELLHVLLDMILLFFPFQEDPLRHEEGLSQKAVLVLTASHIFHHLGPLLVSKTFQSSYRSCLQSLMVT